MKKTNFVLMVTLISCFSVLAQEKIIVKGTVTDASSQTRIPLSGVNISEKGTNNGTTTDFNGKYELKVRPESTLEVSSIGYKSREIPVNGQTDIDINLEHSSEQLSEVVVIGYGSTKRKNLTHAVSSVTSEDIEEVPSYDIADAIQGKASGVQIISSSGKPSATRKIKVRGGNSFIGNTDPLVVIDGFPSTTGLAFLSSSDIKSIDILKDASATAIYGARGANGVIMVTTKRGERNQKSKISINSYVGVENVEKKFHVLNPEQYAEVANEWAKNEGMDPIFDKNNLGPATDWQDVVFRSGFAQNHSITFTGGSEDTNFGVSGNFYQNDAIIYGSDAKKGSIMANLDHDFNNWLDAEFSIHLSRRESNDVPINNGLRGGGMFSGAISAPPTQPVFNDDGNINRLNDVYPFSEGTKNPMQYRGDYKDRTLINHVLFNAKLNFHITEDLDFTTRIGEEHSNRLNDEFRPIIFTGDNGSASQKSTYENSVVSENLLKFDKDFNANNHIDATGGFTFQNFKQRGFTSSVEDIANNSLSNYDLGSAETVNPPSSSYSEWKLFSGLISVNYSFKDRYLFNFNLRADGSSRFGKDNRWGYFPSGSVAWRLSDEPFIDNNISWIDDLKLRLGYGETGSTGINPYQTLNLMTKGDYIFGGTSRSVGFGLNSLGNRQLQWEKTTEFDVGLDAEIFDGRFGITIDYYHKITDNLLAAFPLPYTTGFSEGLRNSGKIQNQGIEFSFHSTLIDSDFKWKLNGQLSMNRNKVKKLAGNRSITAEGAVGNLSGYNRAEEGEPLAFFYTFVEDGLDDEGQIKYKDLNDDGSITDEDRKKTGTPYPDFTFGFSTDFSFKNFSLGLSFQGTYGNELFWGTAYSHLNSFQRGDNQLEELYGNYWTEDNPDPNAKFPKISSASNHRPSDRYIKDASYLRLRTLIFSYDVPIKKIGLDWLSRLEVYFRANNLFTITSYPGLDPSVSTKMSSSQSSESRLFVGTDIMGYPNSRTLGGGLKINF